MPGLDLLSPRELQVARKIAEDKPPKQIADELELKPRTVAVYIERTKLKLGARTLVGIALIVTRSEAV